MNAIIGGGQPFRNVALVATALLLAVMLLASCNTFRQPTPTPEPTVPPTSTSMPSPTPAPATPTTVPPVPLTGSIGFDFEITADTTWQDLFDRFSAEEQSCIRSKLNEAQLAAALALPVMSESDMPDSVGPFMICLSQETVGAIFLAESGLTGDARACLEDKLADVDPAELFAAMNSPESDPAAQAALLANVVGVQECAIGADPPVGGPTTVLPTTNEPVLWRSSISILVANAPTAANGVVYAGADDNHVYALDSSTGGVLWSYATRDIVRSTPTVNGGFLFVGSNDRHVYALNAGTGKFLWRYDTGDFVQYSPTVDDGKVYLGAKSQIGHTIHALAWESGRPEWISETPFTVSPGLTPTVVGNKVYGSGDLGQFYALDASTGALVWTFGTGIGGKAPPTVIDGVVYVTGVNAAYALDESTGALIWSYDTDRLPATEFAAVIENGVYYFTPDNNVYALDIATGEPIWTYTFTGPDSMVAIAPIVSDGVVYVGLESGSFHAIEGGNVIWSIREDGVQLDSPMVANGVLYAHSGDGYLLALNPATGEELLRFLTIYFSDVRTYALVGDIVLMAAPIGGVQAVTAPRPPPPPVPEEKVLTILYWQAPSVPGPYLSGGTKDRDAGAITLEPLAQYSPEGDLLPVLASVIPTVENGGVAADLTSITWTLKEGLMWSDGSDMAADDAVFTWSYCIDENTGCTGEDAFAGIASVEAPDALTVQITFDAPTPYPYSAFVGAGVPIISRAQFANCVGAAASTCKEQNTHPLGTGPYRIVSFAVEEEAVYERNPFYRGEAPYFDRVVLTGGGDAVSAASAVLETGSADYAWNVQIAPETLAMMEAAGVGTVATAFSSLVERVVLNQTNPDPALGENRSEYLDGANPHPFLTFAPIRQAMSMAIDRGLLAEQLYGSAGQPTCNLITGPASYVSTANDACLTQDIAGANKLLDDNGVLDSDGDGIREYNGKPLMMTYQTTANAVRQDTQARIQGWWRQIGIEAELIQHDAGVFFGDDPVEASYRRFFADVQMYANGPDIDPQQYLSALRCSHIPTVDNNWADGNVARACNTDFDTLFAQLAEITDETERISLIKQLNDTLVQSYYEIPLINRGFVSVYANTLEGVRINAWDTELWNIAEWRRSS